MCGFVAILQDRQIVPADVGRRALDTIAHRGPDAEGEWCERDVFLGHRRLSIIDLTTGDQPMASIDGRYVIVFNGEIYNFAELRSVLIGKGARFRTRSDTEVILEGYRRWGANVVERLHGMFAFLIWDRVRSTAFAARDRLGIKPLCWTVHRGALVACSTLEPFRTLGLCGPADLIAVRDLMTFDYIPAPRTIMKGVSKLEPGGRLQWSLGQEQPTLDRYWRPPAVDTRSSAPDERELEALLDRAVKRQMVADVPVGAFLSGGVDSSLLVALMSRHSDRPVRTFAVAFNGKVLDESPIAELVAHRFATEHTVLRPQAIDADELLNLLGRLDEPFCDPAFVPTYALSKLTREHVKVALSGDGGDEVFGGYPKYLLGTARRRYVPVPGVLIRRLRDLPWRPRHMASVYDRFLSSQELIRFAWARHGDFPVFGKDIRQLLAREYQDAAAVSEYFEPWERRAERYGVIFDTDLLMRVDLESYLSENCLVKTDRASMLASLEVRVPYLDEVVLERILPVPARAKIRGAELKALLLPIARRLLPREVWDRPKQGFGGPLNTWLAGAWRPLVDGILDWGESNLPLFDYGYLRRLHAINLATGSTGRALWNPFVFLVWARAHTLAV